MASSTSTAGWSKTARTITRIILKRTDVELVAINDERHDTKEMINLFKQDGPWDGSIRRSSTNCIRFSAQGIPVTTTVTVLSQPDTADILWRNVRADYVIDADSGFTRSSITQPSFHLQGGAKKLIVTSSSICPIFVMGVNHTEYERHTDFVAVGDGLTNCLAILGKVIFDNFGNFHGHVTAHIPVQHPFAAINPYPKDYTSMIAMGCVSPEMKFCLEGMAFNYRSDNSVGFVVLSVSLTASYDNIKSTIKNECEGNLHDYLRYMDTRHLTDTSTFTGDTRSCIFDATICGGAYVPGNLFQLLAWYDVYWGVSSRIIDFISYMDKRDKEVPDLHVEPNH